MSKRDIRLFVHDILEAIEKIQKWTKNLSKNEFLKDTMIQDAAVRNLEIIGEAAKNIPEDIRSKYSDVPWKRVVGFRNIAIHDYFGVDLETIWIIATEGIVAIKPQIQKMRKDLGAES